ncbi:hypothetical protein ABPG73_009258 [Tetrahymena malaccensis]
MVNDYTFQDITIKKNLKIKKKIYFNQYFEIKQQSSAQKSNKLSQLEQNQDAKTQKSLSNTQNISQKKEIIDNLDSINLQAQAQLTINSDFSDNQQINQFDSIQVLEQGDLSYELRIWDRDQAKKDAINTLDLKYSNRVDVILDNLLQKQYYLGKFIAKGGQGAFAPQEQIKFDSKINFKADVYSLGLTLKQIIQVYKIVNPEDLFVQSFEDIIDNKMIQNLQSERQNCQQLHKQFFNLFIQSDFVEFAELYHKKIQIQNQQIT